MALAESSAIHLNYGEHGEFSCELDTTRIVVAHSGPRPVVNPAERIAQALNSPLDFPPLSQVAYPDDKIVLALECNAPTSAEMIAAVWNVFEEQGISPDSVSILQPPPKGGEQSSDPRSLLPAKVRKSMTWRVHDAAADQCAYLSATASGDRIYLARELIDADVTISIGAVEYDPLLGYQGTHSVFYPGLSTSAAMRKAQGQGHSELGPDDERPLRQVIDEIGWLLGTQFSLQVLPSAGAGAADYIAGAADAVFRRGKKMLSDSWLVELEARPELVVAAVDADSHGHGWNQIAAALSAARNLVARGGKILVLSELDAEPGDGLQLIAKADEPRDAIKPLREQCPDDLLAATQCAQALEWADVYLLSRLDGDLVEDLFMIPIESEREAARLLANNRSCALLGSAQHVFGRLRSE